MSENTNGTNAVENVELAWTKGEKGWMSLNGFRLSPRNRYGKAKLFTVDGDNNKVLLMEGKIAECKGRAAELLATEPKVEEQPKVELTNRLAQLLEAEKTVGKVSTPSTNGNDTPKTKANKNEQGLHGDKVPAKIYAALTAEGQTPDEIAKKVGTSNARVRKCLTRLSESRPIEKVDGKWRLKALATPTPSNN